MFENIQELKEEVFYQSSQIDINFNIIYTIYDIVTAFRKIINYCIFIGLIIFICIGTIPIWQSIGGFIALIIIEWVIHKYIIEKIDSNYKGAKVGTIMNILDNYNHINDLEEWEYDKTLESLLKIAGLQMIDKNNN